ncbi:MAG: hypothetical protein IH614_13700 [Desulfuromonadales bacterium]|nr:hypothetical protein [Desulfuromonadales bacterium]
MDWAREMAERLGQAVNGEKDRIIAEYQGLSGKSPATLYRIAAKHGFGSGRKARQDRGQLKSGLTDEQLRFVSTLIQESAREVKGTILPLSEALQIAIDNGVIAPGQISEARLQAILREREMNSTALDAVAPSIRMASEHPNHVHIFDASICIQYYLKGGKGLRIMDERDFREKKPASFDKIKQRLFRLVLADHFSHQLFFKYYVAAGENQQVTFDFLTSAWRGGHHEKLPFRGVPKYLLMDAGSANIAKGILNLLERLEIEIPKNMPHNPRRQGSAECAQEIIETHFEARLRFEPASTIEELNAWALDWQAHWNATRIHRRHGMTRTACWLTIRQEQLRDLPTDEILRDLYAEPEVERTVRQDNTISFRALDYRLKHIAGIRPGKKVRVVLRPYHWPEVAVVFGEAEYLVSPVGKLAGGFSADAAIIGREFKAQPETAVQKARKANENLAFGEERKKGDAPFGGTLQVFGHQADKLVAVPMPRRGTPMEVSRSAVAQEITMVELFKRIRSETDVAITTALNQELKAFFGTSIEVKAADAVIEAIAAGLDWREPAQVRRQAL